MLYATCSILEAENSAVGAQLLATQNDAKLAMPAVEWGEAVAAGRQLLPSDSGPDGLFYALLRKAG
jgi:16S rRNA (cytosine967-C5)-methyltransferase